MYSIFFSSSTFCFSLSLYFFGFCLKWALARAIVRINFSMRVAFAASSDHQFHPKPAYYTYIHAYINIMSWIHNHGILKRNEKLIPPLQITFLGTRTSAVTSFLHIRIVEIQLANLDSFLFLWAIIQNAVHSPRLKSRYWFLLEKFEWGCPFADFLSLLTTTFLNQNARSRRSNHFPFRVLLQPKMEESLFRNFLTLISLLWNSIITQKGKWCFKFLKKIVINWERQR